MASGPTLITPYGSSLVDLVTRPEERGPLVAEAMRLPSLQLSDRSVHDLEMLAVGAFSPLDRFMGRADYERVLAETRLARGTRWAMPRALPVVPAVAVRVDSRIGRRLARS